jgi:hypothetical protein
MSPLSPAAQVVLDAFGKEPTFNADGSLNVSGAIAAALRAAADQVVPDSDVMRSPCREHCVIGGAAARIRARFLAIAAELDGGTTTPDES